MTAPSSLTRNGWGSLHPDPDNKTVLSGHGHRVRVEVAQDWTEINHFDPKRSEGVQHAVTLYHRDYEWQAYGPTQAAAWKEARRKSNRDGYPAPN